MGIQPTPRKQPKRFEGSRPKTLGQIAKEIHEKMLQDQDFVFYTTPCSYFSFKVLPERVIFNYPATIVYWNDGTKTVVVCHDGDTYDEHEGFLLCCAKKLFGNTGRYNDIVRESTPDADQLQRAINVVLHPFNLTANALPSECEGDA